MGGLRRSTGRGFCVAAWTAVAVADTPFNCPVGHFDETTLGGNHLCRRNKSNGWTCPLNTHVKQLEPPTCVSVLDAARHEDHETRLKRLQPCWPGSSAPLSDENQLFFIHIPKAGGSTIENSRLFDDRRRSLAGRIGGHHSVSQSPIFTPGCAAYHAFTMVRNPGARIYSVWKHYTQRLGNAADQAWVAGHVSPRAQGNFSAFVGELERLRFRHQLHTQPQVGMLVTAAAGPLRAGTRRVPSSLQVLVLERWEESVAALASTVNGPELTATRTAAAASEAFQRAGVDVAQNVKVRSSLTVSGHRLRAGFCSGCGYERACTHGSPFLATKTVVKCESNISNFCRRAVWDRARRWLRPLRPGTTGPRAARTTPAPSATARTRGERSCACECTPPCARARVQFIGKPRYPLRRTSLITAVTRKPSALSPNIPGF